ncbi:hypothetical protein DFR30_1914 [Thiogranum longum]|uniref:Uncharacterized protein n=1 Tax=Thiogranum longum TaxID=1537524 RepID=A0A4R1HE98_9GAMM|nr:DUF6763 family protein [Thiogranum longum]TCK18635.1 hypothetical protein DFR30_1914 [Thiogranum longum]
MTTEADPVLRNWYQHLDKGQKFRVVALNEDEGSVDIQYFDGDVEEIGLDSWYELDIEPIEAPENWSGPVDVAEVDDLGTQITDTNSDDWAAPWQEIKSEEQGAGPEEGEDDWGEGRPREEPWEGEL